MMGTLIKILIVFFVVTFLIRKVGGFLVRMFFGQVQAQNNGRRGSTRNYQQSQHNRNNYSNDGEIHIDRKPKHDSNTKLPKLCV
jgi:hypothetical protein